jgi:N-hydroxyarylamine O-acetyltransferase
MMTEAIDAYLCRLGLEAEPPSIDALFRIHRAQVERVPYETTWIQLGERWDIDMNAAVERIGKRGRGGYCFHLNGSLSILLATLGYDVSRHIGGVHRYEPAIEDLTNHLVLTVAGLPTSENPGGNWYVDAGLGDALYEPLPLVAGTYRQGPLTFVLAETPGGLGDWHFTHDPLGSFAGMSFSSSSTEIGAFEETHRYLSTSPESGFVHVATAQCRHQDSHTAIRALTHTTLDHSGKANRFVTERDEWFALLADEFFLTLDDVDDDAKDRLWANANAAHERWLAEQ